jgi:hypothetical protein
MPRTKGNVNRKPGIFGQTIEKVRDENNHICRDRLNLLIQYNDNKGDRYKQVFEVRMKKDGSGVYCVQGANGSKSVLISANPNEPIDTKALEIKRQARAEARKTLKNWKNAEREARLSIRSNLGLGAKGRLPIELVPKFNDAYNEWIKNNPNPNPNSVKGNDE